MGEASRFEIFKDNHFGFGIRWERDYPYEFNISIALILFTFTIGFGKNTQN
jgi:hypothetical protein